ncbi:hypothetical protein [Caldanaerobacter sp.]|uniref:hypothetical protein n=1 Tax=Caldanaerobacter sp. TaxID=2930036 RepID=UPI003C715EEA
MLKAIGAIILGIVIAVSAISGGIDKKADLAVIDSVKRVETADNKFSNGLIDEKNYLASIKTLFVESYDESRNWERRYQFSEALTGDHLINIEVEISKVYTKGDKKYVFTRAKVTKEASSYLEELIITKKYAFVKEKGEWKIFYIDVGIYSSDTSLDKMAFTTFEGKALEYVDKFNPLI